jgi:hypothetical protein
MAAISVWSSLLWTQTISLIDHSIRDENNEMVLGEKAALESPINHSNPLVINVKMRNISKKNLLAVINVSERLKRFYADRGIEIDVASLATITDYKGETLDKFISISKITDPDFYPLKWYEENADRLTLRNIFLGKVEDYFYTSIIIFPEQGADEMEIARTFLLFKAGWSDYKFDWLKNVSSWNWENLKRYFALNFNPEVEQERSINLFEIEDKSGKTVLVRSNIYLQPYGWTFHRLEIDAMARIGSYASLGLAFLALAVFSLAALGTWRKVIASMAIIVLAFVYSKGSIGIINQFIILVNSYASNIGWLDWLANSFFQHSYEDVFTIEAYFAILVSGISFPWHYMRKFGRVREAYPSSAHYWSSWEKAREKVRIIALIKNIAVFDFLLSLSVANYYGARAMWQVGLVSAVGVLSAWFLAHYSLPIFYYLIGGVSDSRKISQGKMHAHLENLLGIIVGRLISGWVSKKISAPISIGVVISMTALSMVLSPFFLKTDNDLKQFLKRAPSEQIYDDMNGPGGTGVALFSPFFSIDLYDAKALDQLRIYLERAGEKSRMAYSPLYFFLEVLKEDYGYGGGSIKDKILKEAELNLKDYGLEFSDESLSQEAREIMKSVWGSILDEDDGLLRHLVHFPEGSGQGYAIALVTSADSSTRNLTELRDGVLVGYAQEFHKFKVVMADKVSQYLEIDRIISSGRWIYNILSQLAIAVFCLAYFYWRNKKSAPARWRMSASRSGLLVAVPFIWATAVMYILIMVIGMPLDIASASIGAMAVAIAVDFPLFVVDFFRRIISRKENISKEDVFLSVIEDVETKNAVIDVVVDYMGNAILFAFMMATPVEAVRRVGILEEWVLLNCIIATVFFTLPMMRWTIVGKSETHIFRELFAYMRNGKKYGEIAKAISAP